MIGKQLIDAIQKLGTEKRIKFQNGHGWGNKTMAINGILEQGNAYILIWTCHPILIKEDLKEGQRLVWYNPNCHNFKEVKKYFPEYNFKH